MSNKQKSSSSGETRRHSVFFGFAEEVREPKRRPRLRWKWGKIVSVLALLAVMAYMSGVTALYFFYKHNRGFEDVRYTQMIVWPFKRAEIRKEMGEYFIAQAKEKMEAGDFLQALHFLRNGLARSPANIEARRILAEFYELGMRRPDMAADLLEDGLRFAGNDPDYMRNMMGVLLRNQLDSRVQEIAEKELQTRPDLPEAEPPGPDGPSAAQKERRYLQTAAFSAAQAYYYRGNYDRAEELLEVYELRGTHDGIFLNAMVHWQRGRRDAAISLLRAGLEKYPESEQYYVQLARFYREEGDLDEAMRYSVLRSLNNPLNAIPRIELLYGYHEKGNTEREKAEIEALIRQFPNDEKTLLLLANFAAETGQPDLARRIYGFALQKNLDISGFALLVIEAEIVAGEYTDSISFIEELVEEKPDWLNGRMHIFNSLRSVAYLGSGNFDLGQLYLTEFLGNKNTRVNTLLAVSGRLQKLNLADEAARVLRQAYKENPQNQAVLSELIQVEIARNNTLDLAELVDALLGMRRPSYSILETAYERLGSDLFLFTPNRENVLIELKSVLAERTPS